MKDLIIELDYLATKNKTILIPSCGLDSVPSDAIAYLAAQTLRSTLNAMDQHDLENVGVAESHTRIDFKGGIPGGTASSILTMIETSSRKDIIRSQAPDYLSPVPIKGPSRHVTKFVSSLPIVRPKRYGSFFILIPYNITVVQRTRGLYKLHADRFSKNSEDLPAYADDFSYTESWAASNRFAAFFFSLSIAVGSACLFLFPPLRWFARKVLPAPGQGPSDECVGFTFDLI